MKCTGWLAGKLAVSSLVDKKEQCNNQPTNKQAQKWPPMKKIFFKLTILVQKEQISMSNLKCWGKHRYIWDCGSRYWRDTDTARGKMSTVYMLNLADSSARYQPRFVVMRCNTTFCSLKLSTWHITHHRSSTRYLPRCVVMQKAPSRSRFGQTNLFEVSQINFWVSYTLSSLVFANPAWYNQWFHLWS